MNSPALITGASRGIGRETALVLAEQGYHVILCARSEEQLQQVSQTINNDTEGEASAHALDLTDKSARQQFIETIKEEYPPLGILVNNAGFGKHGHFHETSWNAEENMIELNITALTHLTKAFSADMLNEDRGKIMNIASVAGFLPGPYMPVYSATKSYVISFTQSLAAEYPESDVSFTAFCPGATNTSFFSRADMGNPSEEKRQQMASAREVAADGIQAMHNGKTVSVQGWKNKLIVGVFHFIPGVIQRWLTRKVLAPEHNDNS